MDERGGGMALIDLTENQGAKTIPLFSISWPSSVQNIGRGEEFVLFWWSLIFSLSCFNSRPRYLIAPAPDPASLGSF